MVAPRLGHLFVLIVAAAVFAVDRLTKTAVVNTLPLGGEVPVVDHILWIQHLENPCAAFSLCAFGPGGYLVLTAVISVGVIVYAVRTRGPWPVFPMLGLILGGAIGNGYDRLTHGSVVDFIAFHWWPTFNVADVAISLSVVGFFLGHVLGALRQPPDEAPQPSQS